MALIDFVIPEDTLKAVFEQLSWERLAQRIPARAFAVCALTLIGALLLGGGTRDGFLSDALLELMAVPALLIAVTGLFSLPSWRTSASDAHWPLLFCVLIVAVPLVQLVPLPPSIWTRLPAREQIVQILGIVSDRLPWRPISVSPVSTWLSLLSLLPPLAIFLSALQLTYRERRRLSLVLLGIGMVSLVIGMMQVAEGPASALRFFSFTNKGEAVGFFANRNHFAALMYVMLLFAAVWVIDAGYGIGSWADLRNLRTTMLLILTAGLLGMVVIMAGEAMARSRAGLLLTIVALVAIYGMVFVDRRNVFGSRISKILVPAMALGAVFILQFGLYRILDRFATDPLVNARTVFARNTIRAAWAFMPFGAGLGTFVPVYQMFERPIDILANVYANRAHDDFLELWLETGIVGPLLIAAFVAWLSFRIWRTWRRSNAPNPLDDSLVRAAGVAVLLLLVHSAVDYPMRTEAMMAIFAVSCALLIEPLRHDRETASLPVPAAQSSAPGRRPRGIAPAKPASPRVATRPEVPTRPDTTVAQPRRLGRWGEDVEWPEEWRSGAASKRGGSPPASPATATDPEADPST